MKIVGYLTKIPVPAIRNPLSNCLEGISKNNINYYLIGSEAEGKCLLLKTPCTLDTALSGLTFTWEGAMQVSTEVSSQ